MSKPSIRERLAGSPCCLPKQSREFLYSAYRQIGFTKWEAFSSWAEARHEWTGDPDEARREAAGKGIAITSYHLPPIGDDLDAGIANALDAARFAARLGTPKIPVLFKANTREIFAKVGKRFLDALDEEGIDVLPVVQNHKGTAITTLEDYREVLDSINDPRLKGILEVGHFQRVGVSWKQGWDFLGDRIGLIHVNEIREDGQSVHFGTGEVDFAGLMKQIRESDYAGNIVVELELEKRDPPDETLQGLQRAFNLLCDLYENA